MGKDRELPVQKLKEDKEKYNDKVPNIERVEVEVITEIEKEEEGAKKDEEEVKVEVLIELIKKGMIKIKILKEANQETEVGRRIEIKR